MSLRSPYILALLAACSRPTGVEAEPHTLVLIVLDTVRADHTSMCGYERPTTPFLASMPGAHACSLVTPDAWTLPSHATYFTGLDVPTHGVRFETGAVEVAGRVTARPLDPSFTTLAEALSARGWSTALISGNAVLNPSSGLTQGFDVARAPTGGDGEPAMRGERLAAAVKKALAGVPADAPLLLVVNIYDAHDPYPAVGPHHPWLPPHPRLPLRFTDLDSPYVRFHQGKLSDSERADLLAQATDTYDHGVEQADATLRGVWAALEQSGRLDRRYRAVVTADHGELLGEHERMRHGGHLWEPLLRAPLVYVDSGGPAPDLGGDVAGIEVYGLLLDGRLADPRPPVVAFAEQVDAHPDHGVDGAVLYQAGDKFWALDGAPGQVYHLAADRAEGAPAPAEPPPALAEAAARWRAARARGGEGAVDPAALRALGYAE